MATINPIGNGLSGVTGTGNFVGSNSPTLVTPVLGVASATSINFGGSTLSTYTANTSWTPAMTFGTPGDLSVAYAAQSGLYTRIGNSVTLHFYLAFTPTYTTASGSLNITGLPFTSANGPLYMGNCITQVPIFPAGRTSLGLQILSSTNVILLVASGSGVQSAYFATTQFTTGALALIAGSISYLV